MECKVSYPSGIHPTTAAQNHRFHLSYAFTPARLYVRPSVSLKEYGWMIVRR